MEKLRLGIIGTGSVVREIYRHLYFHSTYSHLLDVAAAADPNPEALAAFCDEYSIPKDRRFTSYEQMIDKVKLDAVQVNTPDSLHEQPTIFALEHSLDVLVPKPLADTTESAHRMIEASRKHGRALVVDFHKRDDPRIREITARYRAGAYGQLQTAVFYMLDKLLVADPNHAPRFFASADFAEKNSPISFLTVHMADALLTITGERPVSVRAAAWSQKLPGLRPLAVKGYDTADVEIVLQNGGVAHIITGWHLPNAAHATTVQSARLVCSEGLVDLGLDMPGCRELTHDGGIIERNPLFRNFEPDGTVSGYGISRPGRLYQKLLANRNGTLDERQRRELLDPVELGFWTTVVLEAAEQSLRQGTRDEGGAVRGAEVQLRSFLSERLGEAATLYG